MARLDVVVAGGSVAGLSFAAEATRRGLEVLVLEEHAEVGEPEKCDGLVSVKGLRRYGFAPPGETIQSLVREGVIHAPSGGRLSLSATSLEVVVLDRSLYDKELASIATNRGARVRTGARVRGHSSSNGSVKVQADALYECSYFVDATGPASSPREGILPAAKYEVEADWFTDGEVEVYIDQKEYPGFFAWVIPCGGERAKVGAAGHGINPFKALDRFLEQRAHRVLRKVAAPIYVGGPSPRFVSGRVVYVGESAGQVKPTTAGGITTSVAAGVIAARWVADAVAADDPALLVNYGIDWMGRFDKEMKAMSKLREIYERLSNKDIDALVSTLASPRLLAKLGRSDFDFHASGLLSALGMFGLLKLTKLIATAEVKQLLSLAS